MIRRIWDNLARPATLGALLIGGGLLWIIGPITAATASVDAWWWTAPFRAADLASVAMALTTMAGIVGIALLWEKIAGAESFTLQQHARPVGLALVVAGVGIALVHWFVLMSRVEADRMTMRPGEEVQSYETTVAGVSTSRMLPIRAVLSGVDLSGTVPQVELTFTPAGSDEPIRETLPLGEGVNVEGMRFTPVGFDQSRSKLVGTFEGKGDETIAASAAAGQSFKVSLEGPTYRVEEIVRNYMGALGAAGRMTEPDGETYWVFRRQTLEQRSASEQSGDDSGELPPGGVVGSQFAPDLDHAVRMTGVRESPGVVMVVTPRQPLWPLSVGGLFFMLGFGVIVGTGGRRDGERRKSEDREPAEST